jgi:hypothetical protein
MFALMQGPGHATADVVQPRARHQSWNGPMAALLAV